ncbi:response regulator [Mucilaginibacter sp.]|uniref:response regulator n=1 Tax=Mucilaginibacter sp. TaxID=1882438 RepID=UPI002602C411|nr:response regulator [Mucilaginibacter sp.]MDB5126988.1 two-component system, OmpR family, alkaline phosphatase synthesis response regulator PhoP [Mucilaginibacter sp.]
MRRILLISTDAAVKELLCANSSLLNANVEVNECTQDLLQKIKHRKPDVLVIDFILNNDNGGGLCHQVKSDPQLRDLPVVLLSEYTTIGRIASKFGCDAIVNKPANVRHLTSAITNLLRPHHAH